MKVLIVYCHPCAESYVAAVRDAVLDGLARGGHEARLIDLYAEGFDPVMGADERRRYHDRGANAALVTREIEALRWCEGLVFVYPTWWYGQPAMLKGWLERVWVPHATFTMPQGDRPIGRVLTNIRLIAAVSTLGSPWWFWTLFMRSPGRSILLRGLRVLCAPGCRTLWLALHKLDTAPAEKRRRFLAKVEACFAGLR
jgi:NAD(P)H dehydrogenase (quinone)